MAWSVPWNLMGLVVSGDIGDDTIYTDRFGRKVVFPISPPTKPPSPAQAALRERFRLAQADYTSQTAATKEAYEDAVRKASIVMTGQNLWISVAMTHRVDLLATVAQQTGVTLIEPTLQ